MKFRITKGKRTGHEFEVRTSEVRLGRRSDNDIILDDESASGHHASLAPDRGGVLVKDCGSVNGIQVNGKTVKSAPLSAGDRIAIGMTEIEALADEGDHARDSTDLLAGAAARGAGKSRRGGSSPMKMALAALLVLGVVAMGWYVFTRKAPLHMPFAPAAKPTSALADDFFRLRYEKVQASVDNIFRYEMRIENDSIAIAVDDLKQSRRTRRNKAIDPKQASDIRDEITDQQVFSLPPRIEGKSTGVHDSWRLTVVMRGEAHNIEVLNRIPPENFKRLCAILERFGEAELGMVPLSMSVDELKKSATDAFQRAKKLYDERFVKADNLFNSIKAYTEAIWYLDSVEPKPPFFADAIHGKQKAGEELDEQVKDHEFRAQKHIQLKEWAKAREELGAILQKLPDPADRHNQDARIRLLDVEKRLTPR